MRHNRDEKRFDRTSGHLRCMLANMTNDLVLEGRIKTTTQRAKVLRRHAERMITLGKAGTLAARRRAMAFMRNKVAVNKLFEDVAPQYKERNGGYTRILKLGIRPGDAAQMSIIELVEGPATAVEVSEKPKAKKAAAKPKTAKAAAPKAEKKAAAPKKASKAKAETDETGEKKAPAKRTRKPAAEKKESAE